MTPATRKPVACLNACWLTLSATGAPELTGRPAVPRLQPVHELTNHERVGGGEETRRVHHGRGAEQDAVAVDEEDAAVRRQRAEDFRGAQPADHAVEHDRRATRLIELHALFDADVERIPVDDGAVARLIDRHRRAALALDRGGAADHRAALGSARSRRHAQRDERRSGEQEIAEAWTHH